MSTQNNEIITIRQDIQESINTLTVDLEHEKEPVLYKSDLLDILRDLEKIFLFNEIDLDRLKKYSFATFRIVTDDDFQHTALGKRFIDLCRMIEHFITKNA